MISIHHSDTVDVLPGLAHQAFQCVFTSPPYYGLRDYNLPPTNWPSLEYAPMAGVPSVHIPGCNVECDHEWGDPVRVPWANRISGPNGRQLNSTASRHKIKESGEFCRHCGGWRGCLGMEPDPLMFIGHIVYIFRLVWPLLRDDGVVWLNLGDSYAAGGNGGGGTFMAERARKAWEHRADRKGYRKPPPGLKEKDLLGIPWRAALALQADGWYLRSDVIWAKPNAMPESVKDRPTKSHEYIFLLTKSEKYYYNAEAIAEETISIDARPPRGSNGTMGPLQSRRRPQRARALELSQQKGLTQDHLDAIRAAGITDAGKSILTQTGAGQNTPEVQQLAQEAKAALGGYYREFLSKERRNRRTIWQLAARDQAARRNRRTVWHVASRGIRDAHFATFPEALAELGILASTRPGDTVLDMFSGSGTTLRVAERLGRHSVGIDLNPDYIDLQHKRTDGIQIHMESLL